MSWWASIGGVDKTAYLSQAAGVTIDATVNERTTATFTTLPGYVPANGEAVILYDADGTTPLFSGVILSRRVGGAGLLNWAECECAGWELYLDQATVTLSYTTSQTLADVLADIVAALTDYSITLDADQVDGPTLDPFTWPIKRVSDALRDLAKLTGFVWLLSAGKELRMVRPGGNELSNGRFLDGSLTSETAGDGANWAQGAGTDGVTWTLGVDFIAGSTHYYPRRQGWSAMWARYIGSPTADTYREISGPTIPVTTWTEYTFSGYLACHQMRDICVGIRWKTSGGVTVSTDYGTAVNSTETSGYSAVEDLAEYGFSEVSGTPPVTAAYAQLLLRGRHPVAGGTTNPYMFITGLWFGVTTDRTDWAVTDGAATPYCTALTWSDPTTQQTTKCTLKCGPEGQFSTTMRWVADGSQDDFVAYVPAGGLTVGYVKVGANAETVGYGETAAWQWDQATATLSRDTASRPSAGTVVELTYVGLGPFTVSADLSRTPTVELVLDRPDVTSYTASLDAEAASLLYQYRQLALDVQVVGQHYGMVPNGTLRVASTVRGLVADVILTSVSIALLSDAIWEWSARGTTASWVGESPLAEFRA